MLRGHHLIDAAQELIVSASPQLMLAVFGSNEPGDNGVKQPVVLPLSGHGLQSSSRRSSLARIGLVQPTCHGLIGSSRRGGFCDIGRAKTPPTNWRRLGCQQRCHPEGFQGCAVALARCSAETELETLHTARNHLFACGAACRGHSTSEFRGEPISW